MLDFGLSFGAWVLATCAPAFVGLALITFIGKGTSQRYVSAFAIGIFFWFFVDTIEGSSDLDVNFGFTGGAEQIAMVSLFVVGLLVFVYLDKDFLSQSTNGTVGLIVPLMAAVAVGIHGFGEGSAFGSTASQTVSNSLLDAFGGTTAGIAYSLHKALEPMMVGALYVAYSRTHSSARVVRDLLILTLLFTLPSLVGAAVGYFVPFDASYGFGLGTGTSIYVVFKLARQVVPDEKSASRDRLLVGLAVVLGFILIYIAALFHS